MHIGTMYGDQSIFVVRSVFQDLGGFRDLPLMEDVCFSSRLREYGAVNLIGPPIRSSDRKFSKEGRIQRKMKNVWLVFLYRIGINPERLAQMYYYNDWPSD
jgi:hypothetical protein